MTPKKFIIHCSATRPDWMQSNTPEDKFAEIKRWHVVDNGWSDIGYHFVIDRDGTVLEGRPTHVSGAHCKGHNDSIGVCLIGGFGSNEKDNFADHYTPAQRESLNKLIAHYEHLPVHGHNEFAAKACPGFDVQVYLKNKKPRKSIAESKTFQASQVAKLATAAQPVFAAAAGIPWVNLAIVAAVVIVALVVVDWERIKRWRKGDK